MISILIIGRLYLSYQVFPSPDQSTSLESGRTLDVHDRTRKCTLKQTIVYPNPRQRSENYREQIHTMYFLYMCTSYTTEHRYPHSNPTMDLIYATLIFSIYPNADIESEVLLALLVRLPVYYFLKS